MNQIENKAIALKIIHEIRVLNCDIALSEINVIK